jgi:hypothetical protein
VISEVLPDQIDHVFLACLPMIERALGHGAGDSITVSDLYKDAKRGDLHLWAVHDDAEIIAVIMWSLHVYPAKKTIFVEVIAGSRLDEWRQEAESLLRDLAVLVGADTVEASCRQGLAKRLRGTWKQKAILMELKI